MSRKSRRIQMTLPRNGDNDGGGSWMMWTWRWTWRWPERVQLQVMPPGLRLHGPWKDSV